MELGRMYVFRLENTQVLSKISRVIKTERRDNDQISNSVKVIFVCKDDMRDIVLTKLPANSTHHK